MKNIDYHSAINALSGRLLEVRTEANKGNFSESIIATRQATAALDFFAKLKGIDIDEIKNWSKVLALVIETGDSNNCKLSSICKYYEKEST